MNRGEKGESAVCRSIDVSRRTGRAITRRLDAGAVRWLARWFITNIRFYYPPHYTLHITRSNRLCFLYIHHRHPPSDEKVPKCIFIPANIYIYRYILLYMYIYFGEISSTKPKLWKTKKWYRRNIYIDNEKNMLKNALFSRQLELIFSLTRFRDDPSFRCRSWWAIRSHARNQRKEKQ